MECSRRKKDCCAGFQTKGINEEAMMGREDRINGWMRDPIFQEEETMGEKSNCYFVAVFVCCQRIANDIQEENPQVQLVLQQLILFVVIPRKIFCCVKKGCEKSSEKKLDKILVLCPKCALYVLLKKQQRTSKHFPSIGGPPLFFRLRREKWQEFPRA